MKSRLKLVCDSVARHQYGGETLKFVAQYDSSIPEDLRFQTATPSASLEIYLNNPVLIGTFNPGDAYYLDMTPVEPATA